MKMKKLFILVLCFVFISTGSLPVFADSVTAITVSSSASSVLVDGEDVAFDAYNIGGNNYFKLRDLAYILNGTEKQFEVGFDSAENAIILTSGEKYTPAGGEMSGGNSSNTAIPATAQIYLDGREIKLAAYNIGGSNYFKLRDLGEAVNFGISYDSAKKMIIIDTSKNYWTAETKEIVINSDSEYQLPGTFTLPVGGEGPRPVVIIVHGSGPGNRDGEVGAIKVYKDLAEQLASHGIASIRYDKRTLVHGQKMAADVNLTVKEETIDDTIHAAELALTLENIDKDKIYVAGHSLGGYLIPRIYAADTDNTDNLIAGYISLAGAARPLTELIPEQIEYISQFENLTPAQRTITINQYKALMNVISNLTEADKGKNTALAGAYPSYWLDLADYDPCEEIKEVDKPLLFLQGGTDYQVTEVDFNLFKKALENRDDAKFILYPNLTHAFTYTEQKSKPADYGIEATVDKQVARDIADFINHNKSLAKAKPIGQIYLYGEQHGVEKIMDRQLELWGEYYSNDNMRHLFVELPYYSAEFLNVWMQADNDDILDTLYNDWRGTDIHVPYTKVFYKSIKSKYPETIFHGTDVGHQYDTTGARYLKYLEDNGLKDSAQYSSAQRTIEQGKQYYAKKDHEYRENKMSENFIREFDNLIDKNVMGIYGTAHTGLDVMNYITKSVPTMAGQLKAHYGNAVHSEDLSWLALLTDALRTDSITVNGKEYEASYFGEQDIAYLNLDFTKREFWRLENAYEDFKTKTKTGDRLPYDNYPMMIEKGQVFVIDYTKKDGSIVRMYYRSDGTLWQGNPSTEECTAE